MKQYFSRYFKGLFDTLENDQVIAAIALGKRLGFEFSGYVDMLASANPQRLHHVYEWNQVGNPSARLFEIDVLPMNKGGIITYKFLPSLTPNDNGVIFADKAEVMESGAEVSFSTNEPVPLSDGEFRVGQFTFNPGGIETVGAFRETFMLYFARIVNDVKTPNIQINASPLTYRQGVRDGGRIYDSLSS
jgi:hypothetical protein